MHALVRKLRGAVGLGVTWSLVWATLGAVLAGATYLFFPQDFDPGETLPVIIGLFALLGFLAGLGFASVLAFAERRNQLNQLTVARGALWGALGAVVSQLLLGGALSMMLIFAPVGALLGAASFAVARKALPPSPDAELIEAPRRGAIR